MFKVGDKVIPNHDKWIGSEFDQYIFSDEKYPIGTIVEPPFEVDQEIVDVRWPNGRYFQNIKELSKYE